MEYEIYIKSKKELYSFIINFIEEDEESNSLFNELIDIFEKHEILNKKSQIMWIIKLLSMIIDNHQRSTDFFPKINKIIKYLFSNFKALISYKDVFFLNGQIVLFLLENELIEIDDSSLKSIKKSIQYYKYLYPKLTKYYDDEMKKRIEYIISQEYDDNFEKFVEKFHEGVNDSYICYLIRQD